HLLPDLAEKDKVALEMELDPTTPSETSSGRGEHLCAPLQEVSASEASKSLRKTGKVVANSLHNLVNNPQNTKKTTSHTITNVQTSAGSGQTPRAAPIAAASPGTPKGKRIEAQKLGDPTAKPKL